MERGEHRDARYDPRRNRAYHLSLLIGRGVSVCAVHDLETNSPQFIATAPDAEVLQIKDLPVKPRNATRVVLYANEEQGIYGGKQYASKHADELSSLLIGAESDLGAGRIYAMTASTLPCAQPTIDLLAEHLQPLGIEYDADKAAWGGADVGQMRRLGMAAIDLRQDATQYFDLHHTANDTLDKVNPEDLQQNLAAWVTMVYLTADSSNPFGPIPIPE